MRDCFWTNKDCFGHGIEAADELDTRVEDRTIDKSVIDTL